MNLKNIFTAAILNYSFYAVRVECRLIGNSKWALYSVIRPTVHVSNRTSLEKKGIFFMLI